MDHPVDSSGATAKTPADTTAPSTELGSSTNPAAIEADGLVKRFGRDITAVDGVDLRVEPGEIFGLVGPDGAGKSTLIRMLSTVLEPTEGEARVFGSSVTKNAGAVKPRIGYMSQRFSLYADMTVRENLAFFAKLRGVPREKMEERITRALDFSALTEFSERQSEYLSGGMKQKLALAVTLLHEPDLLFLDEPTTGVDPVSRREFWRIISALHQSGITVFVATPYMDEAELCSTVAFLEAGRIAFLDSPSGLKARVPGRLVEVDTSNERQALTSISCMEGVISAVVHGDLVRALVEDDGPDDAAIEARVRSAGVDVRGVRPGRIDMEATFAFLADESMSACADDGTEEEVPEL